MSDGDRGGSDGGEGVRECGVREGDMTNALTVCLISHMLSWLLVAANSSSSPPASI